MKKTNIGYSIVKNTHFPIGIIPLDVLVMDGTPFNKEKVESQPLESLIMVDDLFYEGDVRKTPYSPISTIYSLVFD